jgi:hypothetical protein
MDIEARVHKEASKKDAGKKEASKNEASKNEAGKGDRSGKRMDVSELMPVDGKWGGVMDTGMAGRSEVTKKKAVVDNEPPYAVLGAPVGCGKTYCILSMCLHDKFTPRKTSFWDFFSFKKHVTGATLIVVPSHLFHQWDAAITRFAGDDLVVHRFNGYPDVMRLNDTVNNLVSGNLEVIGKLRSSDVFLVSSLYYQPVATTLLTADVTFRRLVFDEADSMQGMINYASPAAVTWFVSASIRSVVGDGLRIGCDRASEEDSTYYVPVAALERNFVDCDVEFIKHGFALPTLTLHRHVCSKEGPNRAVACMAGVFDEATRRALYACDTNTVEVSLLGRSTPTPLDELGLAEAVREGWSSKLVEVRQHAEDKSAEEEHPKKGDELAKLRAEEARLVAGLEALDLEMLSLVALEHGERSSHFTKVDAVMDVVRSAAGRKTLIFTEFPRVLYAIQTLLDREKIKYVDFEGGNQDAMARSIRAYAEGDAVNVMLAHSATFSCGTNLECTQHIIFMHRIPDAIRSQVIGRGQRPGRVGPLAVTDLRYADEDTF